MSILMCRQCGSLSKVIAERLSGKRKIVKIQCPNCKKVWQINVAISWNYEDCLNETYSEYSTGSKDTETAFGMLLKKALEKSK